MPPNDTTYRRSATRPQNSTTRFLLFGCGFFERMCVLKKKRLDSDTVPLLLQRALQTAPAVGVPLTRCAPPTLANTEERLCAPGAFSCHGIHNRPSDDHEGMLQFAPRALFRGPTVVRPDDEACLGFTSCPYSRTSFRRCPLPRAQAFGWDGSGFQPIMYTTCPVTRSTGRDVHTGGAMLPPAKPG